MLKLLAYLIAFATLAAVAFAVCQGGSNMARNHNARINAAMLED